MEDSNQITQAHLLSDALISSIIARNQGEISQRFLELDDQIAVLGSIPDPVFHSLVHGIGHRDVQVEEGSVQLLKVFEYNAGMLTEFQKNALVCALESSYERFADSTACFLITEIMVDVFGNERSLQVLCRLASTKNTTARALVAHGLEYFIKKCDTEAWSAQAHKELLRLSADPAELVHDEASAAIARLRMTRPA